MIVNRLSYVNSENKEINLLDGNIRALKTSDIFSHEWDKKDTSSTVITSFEMQDIQKTLDLAILAKSKDEVNKIMEKFYRAYEKDVLDSKEGRLYFNDYYLLCNINKEIFSSWDAYRKLQKVQLGILSRKGRWYKEVVKNFGVDSTAKEGKDFPYDFPYDYADESSQTIFRTDSISDFDFKLEIYGVAADPSIIIGGHIYRVFASVNAGEVLTIDSREKTVKKRKKDGSFENLFYLRDKDNYIFQKIKCKDGRTTVLFEDNIYPLVFRLTAYVERSRPLWT